MRNAGGCGPEFIWEENEALPQEERYLIQDREPPRSLLPGEEPLGGEGLLLTLLPGARVDGVAGAGGIVLDGEHLLGGWCSFRCQLAVPRRFAAREGRRAAEGAQMEQILRDRLCDVLRMLFAAAGQQTLLNAAHLKKQLSRQLRDAAEEELMRLGWRMTYCRLEKILITRSE